MIQTHTLKDCLRKGIVYLEFEKADGSIREMRATLCQELIPDDKQPKGKRAPSEAEELGELIKCYDVDIDEWRSFRLDSVILYSIDTPIGD